MCVCVLVCVGMSIRVCNCSRAGVHAMRLLMAQRGQKTQQLTASGCVCERERGSMREREGVCVDAYGKLICLPR